MYMISDKCSRIKRVVQGDNHCYVFGDIVVGFKQFLTKAQKPLSRLGIRDSKYENQDSKFNI